MTHKQLYTSDVSRHSECDLLTRDGNSTSTVADWLVHQISHPTVVVKLEPVHFYNIASIIDLVKVSIYAVRCHGHNRT